MANSGIIINARSTASSLAKPYNGIKFAPFRHIFITLTSTSDVFVKQCIDDVNCGMYRGPTPMPQYYLQLREIIKEMYKATSIIVTYSLKDFDSFGDLVREIQDGIYTNTTFAIGILSLIIDDSVFTNKSMYPSMQILHNLPIMLPVTDSTPWGWGSHIYALLECELSGYFIKLMLILLDEPYQVDKQGITDIIHFTDPTLLAVTLTGDSVMRARAFVYESLYLNGSIINARHDYKTGHQGMRISMVQIYREYNTFIMPSTSNETLKTYGLIRKPLSGVIEMYGSIEIDLTDIDFIDIYIKQTNEDSPICMRPLVIARVSSGRYDINEIESGDIQNQTNSAISMGTSVQQPTILHTQSSVAAIGSRFKVYIYINNHYVSMVFVPNEGAQMFPVYVPYIIKSNQKDYSPFKNQIEIDVGYRVEPTHSRPIIDVRTMPTPTPLSEMTNISLCTSAANIPNKSSPSHTVHGGAIILSCVQDTTNWDTRQNRTISLGGFQEIQYGASMGLSRTTGRHIPLVNNTQMLIYNYNRSVEAALSAPQMIMLSRTVNVATQEALDTFKTQIADINLPGNEEAARAWGNQFSIEKPNNNSVPDNRFIFPVSTNLGTVALFLGNEHTSEPVISSIDSIGVLCYGLLFQALHVANTNKVCVTATLIPKGETILLMECQVNCLETTTCHIIIENNNIRLILDSDTSIRAKTSVSHMAHIMLENCASHLFGSNISLLTGVFVPAENNMTQDFMSPMSTQETALGQVTTKYTVGGHMLRTTIRSSNQQMMGSYRASSRTVDLSAGIGTLHIRMTGR